MYFREDYACLKCNWQSLPNQGNLSEKSADIFIKAIKKNPLYANGCPKCGSQVKQEIITNQ